mmetsp:Transcript_13769/g.20785  ORF Transcript_13769/g.20785 Transcript_13769/m.20785 type:complete len:93 (-) Transcript_13769:68-346(-)
MHCPHALHVMFKFRRDGLLQVLNFRMLCPTVLFANVYNGFASPLSPTYDPNVIHLARNIQMFNVNKLPSKEYVKERSDCKGALTKIFLCSVE